MRHKLIKKCLVVSVKMLYRLIKLCTVLYSFKISFLLIKLYQFIYTTFFYNFHFFKIKKFEII
jgi:hypothetical protein